MSLTALAVVIALALALAALEALSRVIAPVHLPTHPRGLYVNDPAAGYRMAPHFTGRLNYRGRRIPVRTNSAGLRDREYGPRTPGVRRVFMVGDSQTFGLVDEKDTLPHSLERQLAAGGGRWEVINAGVPGYGTHQALATLRRLAPLYRPDVVVLTVYPNDSFENGLGVHHFRVKADGYLHDMAAPAPRRPTGTGAAWSWITARFNLAALASRAVARLRAPREAPRGQVADPITRLLSRRWDAAQARDWALTDSLLGEVVRVSRASGAVPVLVDGGSRLAVSWSLWPARTDTTRYDRDRQATLLDDAAARTQAACVHVLPAFRSSAHPEEFFLTNDEHWNPRGNAAVAALVAPVVRAAITRIGS